MSKTPAANVKQSSRDETELPVFVDWPDRPLPPPADLGLLYVLAVGAL